MSAEDHVTVSDIKRAGGVYLTSRGMPQEGIVFVCREHGIQGFHSISHAPLAPHGIQLDCRCFFVIDMDTGAISR